MATRKKRRTSKDEDRFTADSMEGEPQEAPAEEKPAEDPQPEPKEEKKAAKPKAKSAPKTAAQPVVVMGHAHRDPHAPIRKGSKPLTANQAAKALKLHPVHAAGFKAWAKIQGHGEKTLEEWRKLHSDYLATPVR